MNHKFEVYSFTKQKYDNFGTMFPHSSHFYENEEEAIQCFSELIKSGIYRVEFINKNSEN